jgi:hypothetical protein
MKDQLLDEMSKHRFSVIDLQQGTVEPISEKEFREAYALHAAGSISYAEYLERTGKLDEDPKGPFDAAQYATRINEGEDSATDYEGD